MSSKPHFKNALFALALASLIAPQAEAIEIFMGANPATHVSDDLFTQVRGGARRRRRNASPRRAAGCTAAAACTRRRGMHRAGGVHGRDAWRSGTVCRELTAM